MIKKNTKILLSIFKSLIFIFRTKDAHVKNKNSESKLDLFDELNSNFQIIQIINLTDFFKEFSMVIAKNRN